MIAWMNVSFIGVRLIEYKEGWFKGDRFDFPRLGRLFPSSDDVYTIAREFGAR